MAAFLDNCRFNVSTSGTSDHIFASAFLGSQSPALSGAVNGRAYKFLAISADQTQWEIAEGVYTSGTGTFARTTVLYNSSGTGTAAGQSGAGTKITFSTSPTVAIIGVKEDLLSIEEANAFTATQKAQAINNLKAGGITVQTFTSGTGATYTKPANCTWIEVFIVGAGGGGAGANTATATAGSAGGDTTFNSIVAKGGGGGSAPSTNSGAIGGAGGTGGTGTAFRRIGGQSGYPCGKIDPTNPSFSGAGGASGLGGGGGASAALSASSGVIATAGTNGGGGGGAWFNGSNYSPGSGGGGGELAYLIVDSPSATYTYTVGAAGAGGVASQSGAAGGSGFIQVVEHYGLP